MCERDGDGGQPIPVFSIDCLPTKKEHRIQNHDDIGSGKAINMEYDS